MVNAAGLEDRALTDDRLGDLGIQQLAGGQVAGTGVDGEGLLVEGEGRIRLIGQRQVGLIEGTDGSYVFPVCLLYTSPSPRD